MEKTRNSPSTFKEKVKLSKESNETPKKDFKVDIKHKLEESQVDNLVQLRRFLQSEAVNAKHANNKILSQLKLINKNLSNMASSGTGSLLDDAFDLIGDRSGKKGKKGRPRGRRGRISNAAHLVEEALPSPQSASKFSQFFKKSAATVEKNIPKGSLAKLGKAGLFGGAALAVAPDVIDLASTLASNKSAKEKASASARTATNVGGSLVGGEVGASIGGAIGMLGGPAAPVTVPLGAFIGGAAGSFGGSYLGDAADAINGKLEGTDTSNYIGRAVALAMSPFSTDAQDALSSDFTHNIVPLMHDTVKPLTANVKGLSHEVKGFGEGVADLASSIGSSIATLASTISAKASGFAQEATDGASNLWNRAKNAVGLGTPQSPVTSDTAVPKFSGKKGGFDQKAPEIMDRLMKDFQLNPEQAAGIMGNLGHESAGFTTMQEKGMKSGRGGLGWAQWTGSRRKQYEAYLAQTGQQANSDEANYGFLKQELTNGPEASAIANIKKSSGLTGVNGAVYNFERKFERSGDVKNGVIVKQPQYNSRYSYAQRALDAYNARQGKPSSASTTPSVAGTQSAGDLGGINDLLVKGTQEAMNRHVKYNYGSKNSKSGAIDCSGWVMELNKSVASQMSDPSLMKGSIDTMAKGAATGGAAGIIQAVGAATGQELSGRDVNTQNLKEGMVIGMDHAQGGAKSGAGRYKGIDHIVQVVKDPETGQLAISESSSKKGVHTTNAEEWLAKKKNTPMYAVDPYASVRGKTGAPVTHSTTDDMAARAKSGDFTASQSTYGQSIGAKQSPIPMIDKNLPKEVQQVQVTNQPQVKEQSQQQPVSVTVANPGNGIDINEIPMSIDGFGLVLLNMQHL